MGNTCVVIVPPSYRRSKIFQRPCSFQDAFWQMSSEVPMPMPTSRAWILVKAQALPGDESHYYVGSTGNKGYAYNGATLQ